jgi:hypothetical protein
LVVGGGDSAGHWRVTADGDGQKTSKDGIVLFLIQTLASRHLSLTLGCRSGAGAALHDGNNE